MPNIPSDERSPTKQRHGRRSPQAPTLTPEALFAAYGERVHRFCVRLCQGRSAEAEDLAQDVLLLAWNARDSFAGRSSPITYLYRIAVNRRQRVQGQTVAAAMREQHAVPHARIIDLSEQTALRLDIAQALATLPDDLRIAFLLVKSEGLTYREAADVLETPQGTVQSRVHSATIRLRSLLTDSAIRTGVSQRASSDQPKENCHAM